LVVLMECNQQALTYWKELGLTSKSYKEINNKIQPKKKSALEEALKKLAD